MFRFQICFTIALVSKQDIEKLFWRFLVIQPNLEVQPYLPSTKFLCRMFTEGDTSAWGKYSRAGRTKLKDRCGEPERGSEWEPIKILLEGDENSNKMNTASNTRL
jgi:hypothetical protein